MRIDCHIHTSRYSACSHMTPEEACAAAVTAGLDAIVLTEHHVRWPGRELRRLERGLPLKVYSGVEITLREGYDVVVITGDESLDPGPGHNLFGLDLSGLDLSGLMRRLEGLDQDHFLFVAHPFRYSCELTPALASIMAKAHGIELNSYNILRDTGLIRPGVYQPANASCYEEARLRFKLTGLFNSDSHATRSVGALSSRLPGPPPEDEAGLVRLLKEVEPEPSLEPRLLGVLFPD